MARHGGKAANRRERQRRAQRRALQRPAPTARPISTDVGDAVASAAESRTDTPRPTPSRPSAVSRGGKADPRFAVSGPSRLGDRAAADYHYVVRDLRSIGILVGLMAAGLAVATVVLGAIRG